jgi:hypothetical protein
MRKMIASPRQDTGQILGPLKVDRFLGVRRRRLDTRTRAGRSSRELREHYTALLNATGRDVSSIELASAISRAAELQAISEQLRANALRGLPTSPDDLVRIERLSAHALRTLRLPSSANKQTVTLTDYLASTAAE